MNMNARVHLMISGQVQGVFFRTNTRHTANELGLKGWVRNLP
ncbi:MAG: acylphosphatase, partial [Candidatus Aenigmarchaeota archaeon]|nr:acylphosphatase [Candidatus Aenigmarchaeota archaeon]